ncbi:MAG: carboxymuconolactone decarboxylase family protein [Chitinophagaceae bacterium]
MPHIDLDTSIPGIRSLVMFRPETGKPLYELVQVLLRGYSTLPASDRELIAAYVSQKNDCRFCRDSHAAAARVLSARPSLTDTALNDPTHPSVSRKMQALLRIAGKVQESGMDVTANDIVQAKAASATDREIHDTVLIAATFSLFNRYVDGLATFTPTDPQVYTEMGERMAKGYVLPQKK